MSESKVTDLKTVKVAFDTQDLALAVAGPQSENLKLIERRLGVRVGQKGGELLLSGEASAVTLAERLLEKLLSWARERRLVLAEDVDQAIRVLGRSQEEFAELLSETVYSRNGRNVVARSLSQKRYVQAIAQNDIVFGVGPAGTGKTYLAMAMAVSSLMSRRMKRIVLARPAVEAGEKLGFLPGDLAEKVNPYLRPLYDALYDMMDQERANLLIEQGVIEVAPLAFMRGRTLNDAFAILDEAQNTTLEQMKMFLTRLGYNSKAVVTGDPTQVDLPSGRMSGLVHAQKILSSVEGIAFSTFTEIDVVRHPLVQDVIRAYEKDAAPAPDGGDGAS